MLCCVGVSDTFWNPHSLEAEHEYLWAPSATPFGYFSNAKTLGFPLRDAVARHVLFSDLNHTITELTDLFQHFAVTPTPSPFPFPVSHLPSAAFEG